MAEELKVLTKAKQLYSYIITVVNKAPKRFRFSISAKLMDLGMEVLENIYLANDIFLSSTNDCAELIKARDNYQSIVLAKLKILGYLAMVTCENGGILVSSLTVLKEKRPLARL